MVLWKDWGMQGGLKARHREQAGALTLGGSVLVLWGIISIELAGGAAPAAEAAVGSAGVAAHTAAAGTVWRRGWQRWRAVRERGTVRWIAWRV